MSWLAKSRVQMRSRECKKCEHIPARVDLCVSRTTAAGGQREDRNVSEGENNSAAWCGRGPYSQQTLRRLRNEGTHF